MTAPASVNGVSQKPIEGVSMAYTFADAMPVKSRRTNSSFELGGNRAIYSEGWVALRPRRIRRGIRLVPRWMKS